jgi:acyl-CoA thioesterase-1
MLIGGAVLTAIVGAPLVINAVSSDRSEESFSEAVEAGVKFTATEQITVTGVSFFKSDANNAKVAAVWDTATGRRVAAGPVADENAKGWVTVELTKPILVEPGSTYIASYFSSAGGYTQEDDKFTKKVVDDAVVYPADAGVLSTTGVMPADVDGENGYSVKVAYAKGDTRPPEEVVEVGIPEELATAAPVITATSSTEDSVSIAWDSKRLPKETSYTLAYGADKNNLSSSLTVNAAAEDGVTLLKLAKGTLYYVNVFPTSKTDAVASVEILTKGEQPKAAAPAAPQQQNPAAPSTPQKNGTPNAPAPAPNPKPGSGSIKVPVSVAVLGDSNSNGNFGFLDTGVENGKAYITQNRGYVSFAGGWANNGAPSARIAQNAPSLPNADVAAIMAGTNDAAKHITKEQLATNLRAISGKVGARNTLILALPPFNAMAGEIPKMNDMLRQIAAENGWDFFDPWSEVRGADNKWVQGYTREGLHANPEGYKVMGYAFEKYVAKRYANVDVN